MSTIFTRAELTEAFRALTQKVIDDKHGQLVLLMGESGYGKTTLLEQWKKVVQDKALVALVQCPAPLGSQHRPHYQPLYPFVKALEEVLTKTPEKAKRRLILNIGLSVLGMIPLIGSLFDITKEVMRDLREFRRETSQQQTPESHQMAESIIAIAREQPLVLFIDDAQWIDAASIEVLEYLISACDNGGVIVVLAYEQSQVQAHNKTFDAWLSHHRSSARQFQLCPLTPAEIRQIAANVLTCYRPNVIFDEWLLARSGGIPAVVLSYLHYFQQHPPFASDGTLRNEMLDMEYTPVALQIIIEQTLGTLSPEDKLNLALCSVEGERCSVFVVAHLMQHDPITTVRQLRSLQERTGVIRSLGMQRLYGVETTVYTFTSHAYWRYFWEYLEYEERVEVHSRIAALLQQHAAAYDNQALHRQLVPIIAAHYAQVGNREAIDVLFAQFANDIPNLLDPEYSEMLGDIQRRASASPSSDINIGGMLRAVVEQWYAGKVDVAFEYAERIPLDEASEYERILVELVRVRLDFDRGYSQRALQNLSALMKEVELMPNELASFVWSLAVVLDLGQAHIAAGWEHARQAANHAYHASPQSKLVALANMAIVLHRLGKPQSRIAQKCAQQLAYIMKYSSLATELS